MPKFNVQDIRNIALCGHGSSGKTTLADKLLGTHRRDQLARPASTTAPASAISTKWKKPTNTRSNRRVVHFDHAGKRFNLIDTPGYPDFIGQTIGALQAVETAAIVINAHSGIEVNTRRVFQEAGKAGCGRMIIIDKMDAENIDFPRAGEVDPIDVRQCLHSAECADRRGSTISKASPAR